jgi:hypothetical protein
VAKQQQELHLLLRGIPRHDFAKWFRLTPIQLCSRAYTAANTPATLSPVARQVMRIPGGFLLAARNEVRQTVAQPR